MKNNSILIRFLVIFIVLSTCIVFGNYTSKRIEYKKIVNFNREYLQSDILCPTDLDLNNDGLVNDSDSQYLSDLITSKEEISLEFDYNDDDIVNSKDLLILINCINMSNNYDCPLLLDLNSDGLIDDQDSEYLSELIIQNEDIDLDYDYNKDGVVNTKDLLKLSQCINEYNTFTFVLDDDNLINNSELKIIGNINSGINVRDFISLIDINGDILINDKNNNLKTDDMIIMTGDKLVVVNDSGNTVVYSLSVRGDVLGTGIPTIDSVKLIANHIVDGNVILGNEYLMAADINHDGLIKMNDAMRIVDSITNNS